MKRPDFIEVFARHRGDIPTITGPGLMTRELFAFTGDDPTILYNMEMPYATPMCLGLAMARPKQRIRRIGRRRLADLGARHSDDGRALQAPQSDDHCSRQRILFNLRRRA